METEFHGYIYKITNVVNSKIYVGGASRTIEERFKEHCAARDNCSIHNAIRKYGKENFIVEKIDEAYSAQELGELEIAWIDRLKPYAPYGKGV